jgi:uncharacterized metal-binding protein YceD (DUF177 family)
VNPEMHRPVALDRIGPHGVTVAVEATADELPAIAARLRIVALASLHCAFKLRRIDTVIEAQGNLRARVTETCVMSLDEFEHDVEEAFTVHFVPAGTEDDDPDPEAIDQIPFQGSAVDLGEAAVEQLALALDPFPRKPGAAVPADLAAEPDGPFAGLLASRSQK